MEKVLLAAIKALSSAIDTRTGNPGHSVCVAEYAVRIASELGFGTKEIQEIELAGLLHDIGQVLVPYEAFQGTTSIQSNDLRAAIQTHTTRGAELIRDFPSLAFVNPYILYHQEWVDGSGYPHGLRGDQIPETVQILSLADVYEALRHPRGYMRRQGQSHSEAVATMSGLRGRRWKAELFDRFESVSSRLESEDERRIIDPGS